MVHAGNAIGKGRGLRYLPVAALALAIGCDTATEPLTPRFEFTSSVVFGVRRSPPTITAGEGAIELAGLFEVPHSAFGVTGWLDVPDARRIQLRIRGTPSGGGVQFPTLHFYRSRVSRLPRGTYDVAITHVVLRGALRDSTVIWTGAVTVR